MGQAVVAKKHAAIIGGGIGGLALSIILAKSGWQVSLYEQLDAVGGRARQLKAKGFTFDMGPSWYLMPGVFEHFYELIGEDISKHLKLTRLSPAYKVFYDGGESISMSGNIKQDARTFESIEPGAGKQLESYLARAKKLYGLSMGSFLYANYGPMRPFLDKRILADIPLLLSSAFQPLDRIVSKQFKDLRLKQILEYPMVFLGASPQNAPALYRLISHLDLDEGVFYPEGGLYAVIGSLVRIAEKSGVTIHTDSGVKKINVSGNNVAGLLLNNGQAVKADVVVSNADLHFTETSLLEHHHQSYPDTFWQKKTNGPSAIIIYLGVKGKLPQLEHHNLYLTSGWRQNFDAIFSYKLWPDPASMYISRPSASSKLVAPPGHEAISILIPVPANLTGREEEARFARMYLQQFKRIINEPDLDKRIVFKKIYGPSDFNKDYNSWQGSALGLSHTLLQSAFFRPRNKSTKVQNLYYVGGNTVPGIGLPMCLISAELVYKRINGIRSYTPLESLY